MQTYLDIVNAVLRDINEVPLTATSFNNARGFHAFLKEAVNRALFDIANESEEWPWLASVPFNQDISMMTNSTNTDRKVAIYDFDSSVSNVDWDTFVIIDEQKRTSHPLTPISYEEWQRRGSHDLVAYHDDSSLSCPSVVYKTKDNSGFGLSPIPDKAYTVNYVSWKAPEFLVKYSDPIPFPDRYYGVLVNRALYYVWRFRDNVNQASLSLDNYTSSLKKMERALIKPTFHRMRPV